MSRGYRIGNETSIKR